MIYPNLSSIVCCDANYGIGKDDKIPWLENKDKYVKKDLKHFSKIRTNYNYLIVGSKTFSTLPYLSQSSFLVLTKKGYIKGIVSNYVSALISCYDEIKTNLPVLCIGGESIYNQLLPCSRYLYLSQWKTRDFGCDKFISQSQVKLFKEIEIIFEDDDFKISKLENDSNKTN